MNDIYAETIKKILTANLKQAYSVYFWKGFFNKRHYEIEIDVTKEVFDSPDELISYLVNKIINENDKFQLISSNKRVGMKSGFSIGIHLKVNNKRTKV